jgi:hypothetical protein
MTKDYPAYWRGRQAESLTYDGLSFGPRKNVWVAVAAESSAANGAGTTANDSKEIMGLYHFVSSSGGLLNCGKLNSPCICGTRAREKSRGPRLQLVSPSESSRAGCNTQIEPVTRDGVPIIQPSRRNTWQSQEFQPESGGFRLFSRHGATPNQPGS